MKPHIIGVILLILAFLLFSSGIIILEETSYEVIEDGDCYDRYRNRIQDTTCEIKTTEGESWIGLLLMGIGIPTFVIGLGLILSFGFEGDI